MVLPSRASLVKELLQCSQFLLKFAITGPTLCCNRLLQFAQAVLRPRYSVDVLYGELRLDTALRGRLLELLLQLFYSCLSPPELFCLWIVHRCYGTARVLHRGSAVPQSSSLPASGSPPPTGTLEQSALFDSVDHVDLHLLHRQCLRLVKSDGCKGPANLLSLLGKRHHLRLASLAPPPLPLATGYDPCHGCLSRWSWQCKGSLTTVLCIRCSCSGIIRHLVLANNVELLSDRCQLLEASGHNRLRYNVPTVLDRSCSL